jgi:undecaprenyl-diphosphatase
MDVLQAIVLALTQGLTEFLPISSAAHLILMPRLLGWSDQGLAFDVSVHVGTLAAVLWYFREEIRGMLRDWLRSLLVRQRVGDSRLAWAVLWGTVPVGLAGLAAANLVETHLRSPIVIALATIAFGLLLWWADRAGARQRSEHQLTWKDVLVIGCAQAVALIPGTSRSGITMTAGLMLGLTRGGAARFSFLLSIPVIILAGMLTTLELVESGNHVSWSLLWLGAAVSAVSAYLCIKLFLSLLERIGMLPFVIYRMVLGVLLLVLFV